MKPLSRARRLLSCIRYQEVLVLQGAPAAGLVLSIGKLTLPRIAVSTLFGLANFLLVAHIWALNDWADIHSDTVDSNKSVHVFTGKGIDPSIMFSFSIALLIGSLGLFALFAVRTSLIALCIALLGFVYSFPSIQVKGVVLLSSVAHLAGGLLHFLLGYSLFTAIDANAMLTGVFFALIFTAGHGIQEVQDHDADRLVGIRTNAVVFGKSAAFCLAMMVFVCAYVYLFSIASAGIAPTRLGWLSLPLCALHLFWAHQAVRAGLSFDSIRQLRRRYRVLFALIVLNVVSTVL